MSQSHYASRNIRSLPDEVLENILLESVYSRVHCFYSKKDTAVQRWMSSLSATCKRFRRLLLHEIYRKVNLSSEESEPRILSFLELVPAYGHLCKELSLQVPPIGPISDEFRINLPYMDGLKTLILTIPRDKLVDYSNWDSEESGMGAAGVQVLRETLQSLPASVTSLHLREICWPDLAKAISNTQLSSVHTLKLCLAYGCPFPDETAVIFNAAFPGLSDLTVEDHCALVDGWVEKAFAKIPLQHLTVVGSLLHGPFALSDRHLDDFKSAVWRLVSLNSAILTPLTLDSYASSYLDWEGISMPCLYSLTVSNADWCDDDGRFRGLLCPTFQFPLRGLTLRGCQYIPEYFATWLNPASKPQVWPQLQKLSVATITSCIGPGDDIWDKASEEERYDWDKPNTWNDVWSSSSRQILCDNCIQRNIAFDKEDFHVWQGHS